MTCFDRPLAVAFGQLSKANARQTNPDYLRTFFCSTLNCLFKESHIAATWSHKHTQTHTYISPHLPTKSLQHHHNPTQTHIVAEVDRKRIGCHGGAKLEMIKVPTCPELHIYKYGGRYGLEPFG